MILTVDRRWKKGEYTIGILYVDGVSFCNTLEDVVRTGAKVPGRTAIPAGTFRIRMDMVSPKFKNKTWAKPYKGKVPRLMDVPQFDGVLIHPGNTAADTEGCILVGLNKEKGKVLDSQKVFRQLMDEYLVPASQRGEDIWIDVCN